MGLNTHCHDGTTGTQKPVYKAVYKDPDCDSDLIRSKKEGPASADQPVYNEMEELSVRGPPLGPVQDHENGTQQPGAHLSVPVGHQAYGRNKTLESPGYRDPNFDSELKSKLKGLVCAEQPVYNHVEELSVGGAKGPAKGPAKGRDNGTQQPVCTAVYKDPDLNSKLRPKKKGPVCVQQPVYNHVEELPVREAKGPVKGPDNGKQQPVCTAVYKDPDLDSKLRSKKKGPVCVPQPVYNHVEELSVRGTKGPAKGPAKGRDNCNQQPVCTAVYKDPDLDSELRSKKEGPVCVQQPVYNHVEELSVRGAEGPTKDPGSGNQQPVCTGVYKDPDLDSKLRSKKKGPVCVPQPVYNHAEELSVRGTKGSAKGLSEGPAKGLDSCNQQPVCTAVYKDPDLDKELRPKKKGPVCVQQPVYNHMEELSAPGAKGPAESRENDTQPECNVLESYLECSKRPSQYGTMMSSQELVFKTMDKSKPDNTKKANDS